MSTQAIGLKEFRKNLCKLISKGQKENISYVVLKNNVPSFFVKALVVKNFDFYDLRRELKLAEKQIETGEVYTPNEIRQLLGITT